jgi:hypothetical protein
VPLRCSIEPVALAELAAAAEYYENQRPNYGAQLVAAVDDALRRISEFPVAWPRVDDQLRRCPVQGFKYWLVYSHTSEQASIIAITHMRRRPGYWKDRMTEPR